MNTTTHSVALRGAYSKCQGLTLIEVVIALLVLSIGLLGLGTLQTLGLKFNTSAYYRTQATALAYDMGDRMRGNRQAALADDYAIAFETQPPACVVAGAAPTGTVAQRDIAQWRNSLACRLPLSTGSVERTDNVFTLTVRWDDSQGQQAAEDFTFVTAL